MNIIRQIRTPLAAATLMLVASVAISACGSDSTSSDSASQKAAGNGIDRAFVADMIPHHQSAVQMANIATSRGTSTFVTSLAGDITRTQNAEIETMKGIASRLDAAGVKATSLGIAEHEMGMEMNISELRTADPFDKAFIDMMVPHHQGAIRMARVELAKGADPKAKQLATAIIDAQTREIKAMNAHRTKTFGGPSPAGGVPAETDAKDTTMDDTMTSMDHK